MKPLTAEYDHRWQKARLKHLEQEPLCRMHSERGEVVSANVVDHIIPHRGDVGLFWDETNWQSLCIPCHNQIKQGIEARGYDIAIGTDGMPLDPAHPVYRVRSGENTKRKPRKLSKITT